MKCGTAGPNRVPLSMCSPRVRKGGNDWEKFRN